MQTNTLPPKPETAEDQTAQAVDPATPLFADVRFWDHRCETTGWLSNFHPAPITAGGVMWPTSEHLYQATKWRSEEYQRRIRELENPKMAKRESRIIGGLIGEPSITRKATLMRCAIRAKFGQHPDLAAKLAETRGVIVEASPTDNVWGIGAGDGLNLMGLLLMELRSELQANAPEPRRTLNQGGQNND